MLYVYTRNFLNGGGGAKDLQERCDRSCRGVPKKDGHKRKLIHRQILLVAFFDFITANFLNG